MKLTSARTTLPLSGRTRPWYLCGRLGSGLFPRPAPPLGNPKPAGPPEAAEAGPRVGAWSEAGPRRPGPARGAGPRRARVRSPGQSRGRGPRGARAGDGGGAAGPGAGSGRARVRRRGSGGGRVLGSVCVCARAQAAGGAPRGRRGAGGGRRAWGRGRGSETRRANRAGSCGTWGERRAQARSLAPAPWTKTTATVSTALGPAGGRPLPSSLHRPGALAAPQATHVSRGLWCRTRAGRGGGLLRAGGTGGPEC